MPAGLTLTVAGAAEIEAAYQAGDVVTIEAVAVGDGETGSCHPHRMNWLP